MGKIKSVVWINTAKNQLKKNNYYKEKSVQRANTVKNDILDAVKKIYFSEQF